MTHMTITNHKNGSFVYNDGGRSKYFKGKNVRDCVPRAVAIASGKDYKEVYDFLADQNQKQRKRKKERFSQSRTNKKTASHGIFTNRKWFKDYMESLGFVWHPTMFIGSGCKVHLNKDELPKGHLFCRVSKHCVAVIDGVIHDTYDCSREGTRCVYGYWKLTNKYEKES